MAIRTKLSRALTEEEVAALSHYGADSSYLHAVAQGRTSDFQHDPGYKQFWPTCGSIVRALDAAINSSTLLEAATLHAAHGNGFGVRGALVGNPSAFVGMVYQYPGYISTSAEIDFRDRFLGPRRNAASRPTVLEFRLPTGFNAIDMHHGGHSGEFEFLLGRCTAFRITSSEIVDTDVLSLVLEPPRLHQDQR